MLSYGKMHEVSYHPRMLCYNISSNLLISKQDLLLRKQINFKTELKIHSLRSIKSLTLLMVKWTCYKLLEKDHLQNKINLLLRSIKKLDSFEISYSRKERNENPYLMSNRNYSILFNHRSIAKKRKYLADSRNIDKTKQIYLK